MSWLCWIWIALTTSLMAVLGFDVPFSFWFLFWSESVFQWMPCWNHVSMKKNQFEISFFWRKNICHRFSSEGKVTNKLYFDQNIKPIRYWSIQNYLWELSLFVDVISWPFINWTDSETIWNINMVQYSFLSELLSCSNAWALW